MKKMTAADDATAADAARACIDSRQGQTRSTDGCLASMMRVCRRRGARGAGGD